MMVCSFCARVLVVKMFNSSVYYNFLMFLLEVTIRFHAEQICIVFIVADVWEFRCTEFVLYYFLRS